MPEFDWYKIRFLESAENLKPLVLARAGKTPSSQIARDIAACLQQGRLFYEAARQSPLEIRPLQLFYGMVGFAKALILSRRVASLATLRQAHGLSDVSQFSCRISDLQVRIEREGTFQEFNDVASGLHRLTYLDERSAPHSIEFSSANSAQLQNLKISLKDIFSRVPTLEFLFFDTFNEPAATARAATEYHTGSDEVGRYWQLRVYDRSLFTDLQSLKKLVGEWRARFPFLNDWRLVEAEHFWGSTTLTFGNIFGCSVPELSPEKISASGDKYEDRSGEKFFSVSDSLPLLYGGVAEGASEYIVSPLSGLHIGEFSLHFMALFLLSSLVRYRPTIWAHAVSRSGMSDAPADDKALALIERFLEVNAATVPSMIVKSLNPNEDVLGGRVS